METPKADAIIQNYPYPVAILYRIIAGMDLDEEPRKGLEYILETAEAIARLLAAIALSELILLKENQGIDIPHGVRNDFKKGIKRPGFGIWLNFAREGLRYLDQTDAELVVPELNRLFYDGRQETDLKEALDKLNKLRNALAHKKLVLDNPSKEQEALRHSLRYLHIALARLDFFQKLSFGYIRSIEVSKRRREEPRFHHKGKNLIGDNIAKGINLKKVLADFKETDAVILRYDQSRYLNLYPFYIYDESSGDAADVFYYNGLDKNRLEYIGIDPGGKFFVENQAPEECPDQEAQFDHLLLSGRPAGENLKYAPELYQEFEYIRDMLG